MSGGARIRIYALSLCATFAGATVSALADAIGAGAELRDRASMIDGLGTLDLMAPADGRLVCVARAKTVTTSTPWRPAPRPNVVTASACSTAN